MKKLILFTLLLLGGFAQSATAMESPAPEGYGVPGPTSPEGYVVPEPNDEQSKTLAEAREIQRQRWIRQNAPAAAPAEAVQDKPASEAPIAIEPVANNDLPMQEALDVPDSAQSTENSSDEDEQSTTDEEEQNSSEECELTITESELQKMLKEDETYYEERQNKLNQQLQNKLNQQLIDAVRTQNLAAVERLLVAGADINTNKNATCTSALTLAAKLGNESIVRLLLDYGANIHFCNDEANDEALVSASQYEQKKVIKLLLERGANPCQAMHVAATKRNTNICRELIVHSFFNPIVSDLEVQNSRHRIFTALLVFNRLCPLLPKDVRHLILCAFPELKKDICNSAALSNYQKMTENNTPLLPMQVVRLLVQNHKLDINKTVDVLKAHKFKLCKVVLRMPYNRIVADYHGPKTAKLSDIAQFNPENLEANFGDEIEQNIRTRLGLLAPTQKAEDQSQEHVPLKNEGESTWCSVQ